MANAKYQGPWIVEKVLGYGEEVEGFQVVSRPYFVKGDSRPNKSVNSPVYPHRQSAYRRMAKLNKAWMQKHQPEN